VSDFERQRNSSPPEDRIIMTHPHKPLRTVAAWAAAAAILTLAGCGGGGGDGGSWNGAGNNGAGTGGGTIPASALQNSDGFIAYVKQVVANKLDTSEPIDLGDVVGPRNDTAEAVGI
jgi:hypothetical protein